MGSPRFSALGAGRQAAGTADLGPTWIGVVCGKRDVLEDMPPWQGGGNLIQDVTIERTVHGPPRAADTFHGRHRQHRRRCGPGCGTEYVERIGIENIGRCEHDLLDCATQHMQGIRVVRLSGTAPTKSARP
jgi:cysteine desulfurase/selenocysteine lyase